MRGVVVAMNLFILFVVTVVVRSNEDPLVSSNIEDEIVRETIEDGRGERDELGIRDEWESSQHIGEKSKIDTRRPVSPRVQHLLDNFGLKCNGCDHSEATSVVNAFVRKAKREAKLETERRARNERYFSLVVTGVAIFGAFYYFRVNTPLPFGMETAAAAADHPKSSIVGNNHHLRSSIHSQQQKAAAEERRAKQTASRNAAPTWIELEEKAMWTAKQEKQFVKALKEFGGIPPKERYPLIAEKVNDKSRLECLMHHKLQQFIGKENSSSSSSTPK